ncbi:hypothetical protein AB0N33_08585 [Pseudarthrobacter oxydans]|uniref:hypothetical protein n=1 Tax=Pseudarthrobacter oxydans TaxID=1671 RepID=UPI0034169DE6
MVTKHKPAAKPPWYKRTSTFIIAAGALAAAILGVLNLWDRIFPPPDEDVARIESIHIIKRTPLTGFAPEGIGGLLPLTAVPEAASAGQIYDDGGLARAGAADVPRPAGQEAAATPRFTGFEQFTMRPLPTVRPVPRPTFLTFTPAPTPTTPTPTRTTATPSPTPTGTSTGTDSPSPTLSTTPAGILTVLPEPSIRLLGEVPPLTDEYIREMSNHYALRDVVPPAVAYTAHAMVIETIDEKGETVPPAQVALRLAAALQEVESTSGPQGADPQGWSVAVRVDLQGLANVPLLLTWSLDGLDVPDSWQAEKLAYRVVGATPHDAGVAEIWVPDLKRPGSYNVNIKLSYEATGIIADWRPLALPDTGLTQGG